MTWVSLDRPELKLEDDDVNGCERCEGGGLDTVHMAHRSFRSGKTCPNCRGTGYLHGYDSNHVGLPAKREDD
jgi:DnaJ-class molecular chaperone